VSKPFAGGWLAFLISEGKIGKNEDHAGPDWNPYEPLTHVKHQTYADRESTQARAG
jgi:hypothetical protein